MKKIMALLLALLTLVLCAAPALADAPTYQGPDADGKWVGEVIARQITLFSKPTSSSDSLRKLKNGTQFDILNVDGEYARVSVPNEKGGYDVGYVMMAYVVENPIHIVLRNVKSGRNGRVYALAGPYAVDKRVGTVDNYQRFTVIAETGTYYIVSFREAVAFLDMSADYFIEEDETLQAILASPSTPAVTNKKAKVYGYASTSYGKIDEFAAGTPVQVLYTLDSFAAIRYGTVMAFIAKDDLTF